MSRLTARATWPHTTRFIRTDILREEIGQHRHFVAARNNTQLLKMLIVNARNKILSILGWNKPELNEGSVHHVSTTMDGEIILAYEELSKAEDKLERAKVRVAELEHGRYSIYVDDVYSEIEESTTELSELRGGIVNEVIHLNAFNRKTPEKSKKQTRHEFTERSVENLKDKYSLVISAIGLGCIYVTLTPALEYIHNFISNR